MKLDPPKNYENTMNEGTYEYFILVLVCISFFVFLFFVFFVFADNIFFSSSHDDDNNNLSHSDVSLSKTCTGLLEV